MVSISRRYLFHASASAFSGRIARPRAVVLVSDASSAVGVSGGRAESYVKGRHFRPFVSLKSASTVVEGRFEDVKAVKALTLVEKDRQQDEENLRSISTAKTTVEGLVIGAKKRVQIAQLAAALRGENQSNSDEPSVIVVAGTGARGVVIDGRPLNVQIDFESFQKMPTYRSFVDAGTPGRLDSPSGDSHGGDLPILVSIVKSLSWPKGAPPTARIVGRHAVDVDDFGRLYFGEMLLLRHSRRLTLLRVRLGSPEGGAADFGGVETNGTWFPPIG
jgi:hypothetical protein